LWWEGALLCLSIYGLKTVTCAKVVWMDGAGRGGNEREEEGGEREGGPNGRG
jgi:hypothetical protein